MPETLFIVCVSVICVLAVVLIVWLIVALVRMNRNKGTSGKVVVVDETAYELVPIGEAPTGATYTPPAAPAQAAPVQQVQQAVPENAVLVPVEDLEDTVMLRRNESVPYPEAYARLSSKQRGYVDEILRYAESKVDVKKIVNDKSASVYLGKKLVVRIVIKRGVINARLTVQNNDFIAYTDSAGLNIKSKPVDVKVDGPEMVSAVKDIIDLSFRDLVLERARREEEKKAARREKRRLAREKKLAEEAAARAAQEAAAAEAQPEEAPAEQAEVAAAEAQPEEVATAAEAAPEAVEEAPDETAEAVEEAPAEQAEAPAEEEPEEGILDEEGPEPEQIFDDEADEAAEAEEPAPEAAEAPAETDEAAEEAAVTQPEEEAQPDEPAGDEAAESDEAAEQAAEELAAEEKEEE